MIDGMREGIGKQARDREGAIDGMREGIGE